MNSRTLAITAATLAALASGAALAADKKIEMEKCYGVSLAGKNDCASTGNNSCAGTAKANADPRAWIYVPEGYCERIVNASKMPKA